MDTLNLRQRILLNQPHIESVSGDIASFTTDMKAPLKECKVYFEPIQEGEGDPSHENVRPISGWTGMEIQHDGENLFDNDTTKIHTVIYGTSTEGEYNTRYGYEIYLSAGTYTIKAERDPSFTASRYIYGGVYKKNGNHDLVTTANIWVNKTGYTRTITVAEDEYIIYFYGSSAASLEDVKTYFSYFDITMWVGTEVGDYEPYTGRSILISWQTEIGTIYGGSLDVLKGVLTVEWVSKILDGSDDEVWTMSTIQRFYTSFPNCVYLRTSNENIRSDKLKSVSASSLGSASINVCYTNGTGSVGVRIDDTIDSIDALKTWLAENPVQIVQKVIPIAYQLTPQQLLTLKRTNNIWSNSNGQTEVKFWTH